MTTVFAGPGLGVHLADQGADVVKVEPITGDPIRGIPYRGIDSNAFLALNRNKRSVALDLRTEEGREVLRDLVAGADIVTENFRPGILERQGIDYETHRERNPGLIWVSLTGYGSSGPYHERRGYDMIAQAIGGTLRYRYWPDGTPMYSGIPLGDNGAGMIGTYGIMLALYKRTQTGKGQRVEVDLLRATLAIQRSFFIRSEATPESTKYAARLIPWQSSYRCADDRFVMVAMQMPNEWADLCRALEIDYILDDPQYEFPAMDRVEELAQLIAGVMETRTAEEWMERLIANDVPSAIVNTPDEAVVDPHVRETGMVVKVEVPGRGAFWAAGAPVTLTENLPRQEHDPSPALGQHTADVLREIGYSPEKVQGLADRGIIRLG